MKPTVLVRLAAIVCALVAVSALTQPTGQAQVANALPFAKRYTVTGNYVVGGVDLRPKARSGGFVTGTIAMSGVPANADILAAFLYWETISTHKSQVDGVEFRGIPVNVIKGSSVVLNNPAAPCWSGGGGSAATHTMSMYRADVLRYLPIQRDADGRPTGKRLVNDADLTHNNVPLHTVTLPEAGTGNRVPQSAGATLFVIYRDPDAPLTSIVVYDGLHLQGPGQTTSQTIRGFLQSSANPVAKMTHILGSGAPNATDRLWFRNSLIGLPFVTTAGPASDRAWSNPTYNVSGLLPGTDPQLGFGEQVTTRVDHGSTSPYDCLAWAAIIFSTTVQDTDGDGLIDTLEDVSGLKDPSGAALPDFHAMGASSTRKNVFIEVGSMHASPGTTYGSENAPVSDTEAQVEDPVGHNHLPTPPVIKMVGDAFKNAPVVNPDGSNGISLHIDAGPNYHAAGPEY